MKRKFKNIFLCLIISCSILILSNNVNAALQPYTKGTVFEITKTFKYTKNDISSTTIDKYEVRIYSLPGIVNGDTEIIDASVNGFAAQFNKNSNGYIAVSATFPAMPKNDEITIKLKLEVINDCSLDLDQSSISGLSNHKWYNTADSTSGGCTICGTLSTPVTNPSAISYPITYDANGGNGVAPTESNKEAGDIFTAANNTFIAPANHSFLKWNTKADGSGISYSAGASVTMPNTPLTLYAIWKNNSTDNGGNTNKKVDKNKKKVDKNKKTVLAIPKTGNDISTILALSLVSILSIASYTIINKRRIN